MANPHFAGNVCRVVRRIVVAFPFVCLSLGCTSSTIETRTDQVVSTADQSDADQPYSDADWAIILRENVKSVLVDYRHLSDHRQPLDRYLALIRRSGPETTPQVFPTADDKTSYYINSYNASVLGVVLQRSRSPSSFESRSGVVDTNVRVMVDGRRRRLDELHRLALDASGSDVRVLFAMCSGAAGSPPLYEQPFRPEALDSTLVLVARRAMDNHRMVYVDHGNQVLLISPLLAKHRIACLDYVRRHALIDRPTMLDVVVYFAGTARRQWLNTAVGYQVRILPFERGLNVWTPQ
jgi:uncharacterized protein DUF547